VALAGLDQWIEPVVDGKQQLPERARDAIHFAARAVA
jgi:hypothetical protein